jgi:hypothetical protein
MTGAFYWFKHTEYDAKACFRCRPESEKGHLFYLRPAMDTK